MGLEKTIQDDGGLGEKEPGTLWRVERVVVLRAEDGGLGNLVFGIQLRYVNERARMLAIGVLMSLE
jgi:hypothetical protein